jgi:hypothetical protein
MRLAISGSEIYWWRAAVLRGRELKEMYRGRWLEIRKLSFSRCDAGPLSYDRCRQIVVKLANQAFRSRLRSRRRLLGFVGSQDSNVGLIL